MISLASDDPASTSRKAVNSLAKSTSVPARNRDPKGGSVSDGASSMLTTPALRLVSPATRSSQADAFRACTGTVDLVLQHPTQRAPESNVRRSRGRRPHTNSMPSAQQSVC